MSQNRKERRTAEKSLRGQKRSTSRSASPQDQDYSDIEARLKALEAKVGVVADGVTTIWNNQVELSSSSSKVDEQFCVLVRLVVSKLNSVIAKNKDSDITVSPVTYEAINDLFQEFEEFKKREDFRDHFRVWYMGGDIQKLPELKEDARAVLADAPQEKEK